MGDSRTEDAASNHNTIFENRNIARLVLRKLSKTHLQCANFQLKGSWCRTFTDSKAYTIFFWPAAFGASIMVPPDTKSWRRH